ncbi:recombinase RecA [Platysternon megacephalum]|uniref:Recombinase RecA n=1 Tax=Platysternon megacephalum TaxID=55544 RepID=A0A4D9DFI3_9SAUR|nr:recombinase RecA [Platysternon megacephalum]
MICPMSKLKKSHMCLVKRFMKTAPSHKVTPRQIAATIDFRVFPLNLVLLVNLLSCFKSNTCSVLPGTLGYQKQDGGMAREHLRRLQFALSHRFMKDDLWPAA